MKIYQTNLISFGAGRRVSYSTPKATVKDKFYANIDGYVNKEYDKQEYIQRFLKDVDSIIREKKANEFSVYEKKYINSVLNAVDLSEKIDSISDKFMKDNINYLLKNKK